MFRRSDTVRAEKPGSTADCYRMLRDFDDFRSGEVVRLPKCIGRELVAAGIAEAVE